MNDLFNLFGNKKTNEQENQNDLFGGQFKSMNEFFDQLENFKKTFTGDPEEKLQQMLNDGTMTQDQYNALYKLAKKIQSVS